MMSDDLETMQRMANIPDDEALIRMAIVIPREQYRWLLQLARQGTSQLKARFPQVDKITAEDMASNLIDRAFTRGQQRREATTSEAMEDEE